MIRSNTVLVLGAGASHSYGFPLGRSLLLEIGSELSSQSRNPLQSLLNQCGYSFAKVQEFGNELLNSMQPSVDAFLENRMENHEYVEIGKLSIAAKLMPLEIPDNLGRRGSNKDLRWYEYLFGLMGTSKADFKKNKLSIITFNYDRSLEYFLLGALSYSYGIFAPEAVEMLNQIPIVHVYGQLGHLDFVDPNGRPYTPDFETDELKRYASEISIIHEEKDSTPSLIRAREFLSETETLCFLGSGQVISDKL